MGKGSRSGGLLLLAAVGAGIAIAMSKDSDSAPGKNPGAFTGKPTDFILKMYPFARAAVTQFPQVPVELALALSGLESGWGKSAPQFNFFGTKPGKNYTGKVQQFDTTEVLPKASGYTFPKIYSITPRTDGKFTWKVRDTFRAFDNPTAAYVDFCHFITSGRYQGCYKSRSIQDIVTCIWKAGYATDPDYPAKIMKLVGVVQQVIKSA